MSNPNATDVGLFAGHIIRPAIIQSLAKLDPRSLARNPVMFATALVSVLATILTIREGLVGGPTFWIGAQITIWLWFAVLFANFAEAVAEGRGKARADAFRATKSSGKARVLLTPPARELYEMQDVELLEPGEVILVKAGVDLTVALVETHGRADTAALLEGLELLPRKTIDYRGQQLGEMDLDALLARKPSLALIDEFAHTNVPGSRHPKRWQDVMEVLGAGIDVITTLNIQHIESLNDAIAQITGVRVQETLPDEVLAKADQIELIDLPPEDLIQRLKDGKIYQGQQAGRALENFFTRGKLTALREMALRAAAGRVAGSSGAAILLRLPLALALDLAEDKA